MQFQENWSWDLIKTQIKQDGLVKHQIESFDDFVLNTIPSIIRETPAIVVDNGEQEYSIKFDNGFITRPGTVEQDGFHELTPHQARLRNLTYNGSLYMDAKHVVKNKATGQIVSQETEKILLAKIPIMVMSELCNLHSKTKEERVGTFECQFDEGGYFIVKGGEKVIVAQEKMANNQIYVFENKAGGMQAEVRSCMENSSKSASQFIVKMVHNKKTNTENLIRVVFSSTKKEVPLFIFMKALGLNSNDEVLERFVDIDINFLESSIEEGWSVKNSESAINWIFKRDQTFGAVQDWVRYLNDDVLPHLNEIENRQSEKTYFIGLMVRKLWRTMTGKRNLDDRDHFGMKRLDLTGTLLTSLFKMRFIKFIQRQKPLWEKKMLNCRIISIGPDIELNTITREIQYALSTGNWGISKQRVTKTGVSQQLTRLTYAATLSNLRKMVAPMAKEGKQIKPRQIHYSSFSKTCPHETPEGAPVGLVKNLSILSHVSVPSRLDYIEIIRNEINFLDRNVSGYRVIVNGFWLGNVNESLQVRSKLRKLRFDGIIPFDCSIVVNNLDNEIRLLTDAGRCCRPLLVVENNKIFCLFFIINFIN